MFTKTAKCSNIWDYEELKELSWTPEAFRSFIILTIVRSLPCETAVVSACTFCFSFEKCASRSLHFQRLQLQLGTEKVCLSKNSPSFSWPWICCGAKHLCFIIIWISSNPLSVNTVISQMWHAGNIVKLQSIREYICPRPSPLVSQQTHDFISEISQLFPMT